MVLTGLEKGYCEYNGKIYQQPHKDIYGGMPYDEAERNIRLFASDVMPRLQNLNS